MTAHMSMHPASEILTFDQGPLGQISLKPTSVLAFRLPTLKDWIRRKSRASWRLDVDKPKSTRLPDGSYATSLLKTYPPRMCSAIAHSIIDTIDTRICTRTADDQYLQAINDLVHASGNQNEEGYLHPDYDAKAAELPYQPVDWSSIQTGAGRDFQRWGCDPGCDQADNEVRPPIARNDGVSFGIYSPMHDATLRHEPTPEHGRTAAHAQAQDRDARGAAEFKRKLAGGHIVTTIIE